MTATRPLQCVSSLDLTRYLGLWYEVARFPHGFEKTLVGVTAHYSLRKDGRIKVVNSGFKHSLEGKRVKVKAIAWRADETVPGALKVRFFHLFASDYLVIGLDEEQYRWAVVGNYERSSLWFLSRAPEVSPSLLEKMKQIALQKGYDLTPLEMVIQKRESPSLKESGATQFSYNFMNTSVCEKKSEKNKQKRRKTSHHLCDERPFSVVVTDRIHPFTTVLFLVCYLFVPIDQQCLSMMMLKRYLKKRISIPLSALFLV